MENLINQPVYESENSEKVVEFLSEDELSPAMIDAIDHSLIDAIYYDESGKMLARDIWQTVHEDILK